MVFGQQDFNNIEAKNDVGIVEQTQPSQPAFGDPHLFLPIDRLEGSTKLLVAPGFHFDKHERVSIAADKVDLAAATILEIAIKNLVPATAQKTRRQFFSARAAAQMFR